MKNVTKQYQDLLEGKMSKETFMRNVRMEFPQWVSPVNSFQDAVNILKSKRIIIESHQGHEQWMESMRDMWMSAFDTELDTMRRSGTLSPAAAKIVDDALDHIDPYADYKDENPAEAAHEFAQDVLAAVGHTPAREESDDDDAATLAAIKKHEEEEEAERQYQASIHEKLNEDLHHGYDRVNFHQLEKGTEFELMKMAEITDENYVKAKEKAFKKLQKDPKAYMDLIVGNVDDVEKQDKSLRMQPVKGDNLIDKANGMKTIKKDEKANTQTNLGNKERAKGMPKGVKTMKESVVEALKEAILDEYFEVGEPKKKFAKGQQVKTPEGEVGTVEEITHDSTATVKMEDGSKKDYQENVLKSYDEKVVREDQPDEEPLPSAHDTKSVLPPAATQAKSRSGKIFRLGDNVTVDEEAIEGLKKQAPSQTPFVKGRAYQIIGISQPTKSGSIDVTLGDPTKKDSYGRAAIVGSVSVNYVDFAPMSKATTPGFALGQNVDKFRGLKEKLVKAVRKDIEEVGVLQGPSGATIDSDKNDNELLKRGKGIETKTGVQLKFVNPLTGQTKQV